MMLTPMGTAKSIAQKLAPTSPGLWPILSCYPIGSDRHGIVGVSVYGRGMETQLTLDYITGEVVEDVASQINREHALFEESMRSSMEHAINCGNLLIETKSNLKHGEWLPWVRLNCAFSEDTAQIYMKIATNTERVRYLDSGSSIRGILRELSTKEDNVHVSNNSGNNEWYTPLEYVEMARGVMKGIDLDPASSDLANVIVRANKYYTIETDGLEQEWYGKVWMNPPYSSDLVSQFTEKLVSEYKAGRVSEAIVLVNNATETVWFNELVKSARAIVFPKGRIKYLDTTGNPVNTPLQGQAFIYFGNNGQVFLDMFTAYGWGAYVYVF